MSLQWKWWDGWIWDRHWSGAKWWTERGIWGKRREIQGFSLEPVMMPLFSMVTLPFTVELTFLLLFWETFSLRLSGQGHQWCHKESPVGDVNLATCLHLGLIWLQLMTPLVGIETRDMHPLASGLENCPLFYTHPRCKPCIFFLELWITSRLSISKNTRSIVLSQNSDFQGTCFSWLI